MPWSVESPQHADSPRLHGSPQNGEVEVSPAPSEAPVTTDGVVRAGDARVSQARRRFSLVGAALAVFVAVWLLGTQVVGLMVSAMVPREVLHRFAPMFSFLVSDIGQYLFALPLAMLVFMRVPALRVRRFALGAGRFLSLLTMCFPLMIAGNIIGQVLSSLLSGGVASDRVTYMVGRANPWVTLLAVVIIAPIGEEWVFRKQIIDRTRRYGERVSIVLSALAFGLFHLNLFQFFYAFAVGLIWGYVYMRTSRLRYSILMHMLINLNGVVGSLLPTQGEGHDVRADGDPAAAWGVLLLVVAVIGVIQLIVKRRSWEFYETPDELPRGRRVGAMLGNVGMAVFLAVSLALTAWALFW